MKLNQIKNLGKELTIKELNLIKGGVIIVQYMCTNGKTGSLRGSPLNVDFGQSVANSCGKGGGTITHVGPGSMIRVEEPIMLTHH